MTDDYGLTFKNLDESHVGKQRQKFRHFMRMIMYRNLQNFDTMLLMTGRKGAGKSSASISIALEWNRLMNMIFEEMGSSYRFKFNPKKDIYWNIDSIMKGIQEKPPFSVFILDESVRFCLSEEWNKAENRPLKMMLNQVRTKHFLWILNFAPKIVKLEKTYLESFVDYWLHLIDRGEAAVFVKDENPTYDTWRLSDFSNAGSVTEFSNKETVIKKFKNHPNFWDMVTIPKPTNAMFRRYMAVRDDAVYNDKQHASGAVTKNELEKGAVMIGGHEFLKQSKIPPKEFVKFVFNETAVKMSVSSYNQILHHAREQVKTYVDKEHKKNERRNNAVPQK